MKNLLLLMASAIFLLMTITVLAIDKTATFTWEQLCINGCTLADDGLDAMPVISWKIYMSDTSGVYNDPPIAEMVFDGSVSPSYTSDLVLTLSGVGMKYFVVRSCNPDANPPESGNSNEVNYPYDFRATATPVNFTFTIRTPE